MKFVDQEGAMRKSAEGRTLFAAKDYEGAISAFSEANELHPQVMVGAYQRRSEAYTALGTSEEAKADRDKVASKKGTTSVSPRSGDKLHEEQESSGTQDIVVGLLFLVGGGIATIVSYSSAASTSLKACPSCRLGHVSAFVRRAGF